MAETTPTNNAFYEAIKNECTTKQGESVMQNLISPENNINSNSKINLNYNTEIVMSNKSINQVVIIPESNTDSGEKIKYTITLVAEKGYNFAIKGAHLITVQTLMTENIVFGPKLPLHRYYGKEISLEKPIKRKDQTAEEYEDYVEDIISLFELYKDAVNQEIDVNDSQSYHFHHYRAGIHEYEGNNDKALADYDRAIESDFGTLPDAFYDKGRVLLNIGKTQKALRQFEIAIDTAHTYFDQKDLFYKKVKNHIKTFVEENRNIESLSELQGWSSSYKTKISKNT